MVDKRTDTRAPRPDASHGVGVAVSRVETLRGNFGMTRFVSLMNHTSDMAVDLMRGDQPIMKWQTRIIAGVAPIVFVVAFVVAPRIAAAQSTLAVADAMAFLGTWTLSLERF